MTAKDSVGTRGAAGVGTSLEEHGSIVEREHLGRLGAMFDTARRGPALRVAVVRGEAAIGKSTLLRTFTKSVRSKEVWAGYAEATGSATELLEQALADAIEHSERKPDRMKRIADALAENAEDLATVLPVVGKSLRPFIAVAKHYRKGSSSQISRPEKSRARYYDEVIASLVHEPLVLALDDVHRADDASVEFLAYLVRTMSAKPIFLVLGYEEAGSAGPQSAVLQRLLSRIEAGPEDVPLAKWTRAEITELAARHLTARPSSDVVDWLERRSAGNPFIVKSDLWLLRERLALKWSVGTVSADPRLLKELPAVPEPAAVRIGERLSGLEPEHLRTLQAASIVGSAFSVDELAAVTDLSESEVRRGRWILCQRFGLIEAAEGPDSDDRYVFAHPMVQDHVLNQLVQQDAPYFRWLHRRCAEHLSKSESPELERVAWHWHSAGAETEALDACTKASDELARRGQLSEARRYAALAVAHADNLEAKRHQVLTRSRLGALQQETRLVADAVTTLEEAGARAEGADLDGTSFSELHLHLAKAYRMVGRWGEARAALRAADAEVEDDDLRLRALIGLLSGEVDLCSAQQNVPRAQATLERALGHAVEAAVRAPILGHLGLASLACGNVKEAIEKLDGGMEAARLAAENEGRLDRVYEQHLFKVYVDLACLESDARDGIERMAEVAAELGLGDNDVYRMRGREAALSRSSGAAASNYAIFLCNDLELGRKVPPARDWALTHALLQAYELHEMYGLDEAKSFVNLLPGSYSGEDEIRVLRDDRVREFLNRLKNFERSRREEVIGDAFRFSQDAQLSFNFYMRDLAAFRREKAVANELADR